MTAIQASRRIAAGDLVSRQVLEAVRSRSTLWGAAMIASAWATIAAAVALVAWTPHPSLLILTYPLAVAVIGSRQLGLAILMHEGAHGGLARSAPLNLWLSQWLCAYPVFVETVAYRAYHLRHHAHAQTRRDPDLVLSAPFPVLRSSLWRKIGRDLTGRTGLKQRAEQVRVALGKPGDPLLVRARLFLRELGRPLAVNVLVWGLMAASGVWWAYPLLWIAPLLTWQQMVTRIRNIAEHAVLPAEGDAFRVARTTQPVR